MRQFLAAAVFQRDTNGNQECTPAGCGEGEGLGGGTAFANLAYRIGKRRVQRVLHALNLAQHFLRSFDENRPGPIAGADLPSRVVGRNRKQALVLRRLERQHMLQRKPVTVLERDPDRYLEYAPALTAQAEGIAPITDFTNGPNRLGKRGMQGILHALDGGENLRSRLEKYCPVPLIVSDVGGNVTNRYLPRRRGDCPEFR